MLDGASFPTVTVKKSVTMLTSTHLKQILIANNSDIWWVFQPRPITTHSPCNNTLINASELEVKKNNKLTVSWVPFWDSLMDSISNLDREAIALCPLLDGFKASRTSVILHPRATCPGTGLNFLSMSRTWMRPGLGSSQIAKSINFSLLFLHSLLLKDWLSWEPEELVAFLLSLPWWTLWKIPRMVQWRRVKCLVFLSVTS